MCSFCLVFSFCFVSSFTRSPSKDKWYNSFKCNILVHQLWILWSMLSRCSSRIAYSLAPFISFRCDMFVVSCILCISRPFSLLHIHVKVYACVCVFIWVHKFPGEFELRSLLLQLSKLVCILRIIFFIWIMSRDANAINPEGKYSAYVWSKKTNDSPPRSMPEHGSPSDARCKNSGGKISCWIHIRSSVCAECS